MKKDQRKTCNAQLHTPKIGRLSLLVGALVAGGVLPPLSLPSALAAPLPVPCGGCGNGAPANTVFLQQGSVTTNIDPLTGLPIGGGTNLTVNQTSQVAILNWNSFNIDKGYSVNFVQPSSTSSALNKIWDSGPSSIAGSLTANGQIYLVNHNGIIFANGAQVNTGALIASSLDISDSLFTAGYLTNTQVVPAFSGVGGFVRVDTGAVLNGSRVMLFAPVVENNGTINTPDGQTVLAAGNKVYLEASQDPNLRGVLVEVDVNNPGVADPLLAGQGLKHTEAGVVTNAGDIVSQRGNITLVGFAVNQQGRVSATTSVTENGSVKLLARYGVSTDTNIVKTSTDGVFDIRATQTGTVTLATGSVTQVVPELADTTTTTDGQGFNPSRVEVMGNTINMQSGSSILAAGGQVTLAAISSYVPATAATLATGLDPAAGANSAYLEITPPGSTHLSSSFINTNYKPSSATPDTARVFMDSGSLIDVSGSTASVSVARNILSVQLRGTQLADAPLQRNGYLWGKNVLIDIRKGSTLANYSGEEAQIGRTVAERTSAGGSVKLVSTGDVVMKSGSKVDLSGGQINYTGANIQTTSLISNGVAYDIATASPNQIYDGIAGSYSVAHNKWGITETFNTMAGGDLRGRWDPGYVEGKSAGTLTVLAPNAVIDADIVAKTAAGNFQRQLYVDPTTLATNNYKNTWQMLPQGGTLVVGDNTAVVDTTTGIVNYITNSNVIIQSGAPQLDASTTVTSALPSGFAQDIALDTKLFNASNGLSRLEVYSNKTINVGAGTAIQLAPGGAITLKANTVNMLGTIDASAGTVKLATALTTGSSNNMAGALTVGTAGLASHISTRGTWVNDALQSAGIPDLSKPVLTNGGNISLSSAGDLLVAAGTTLDASGGAWLDVSSKLHGGNGGAITLASGKTPAASVPFKAQLDGLDLRSYGTAGGKGGALTIKAGDIFLGGAGVTGALVLPEAFFQSGGFNSYNLTAQGLNGLTVAAGAVIAPKAKSQILNGIAFSQKSGSDLNSFASVDWLPDWQRAPASITLNSGIVKVAAGAVVRVEPTASINLAATNQLTVLGTLDAPAGSINLSLNADPTNYNPLQSIWLGSQSQLLSKGYFLKAAPNAQNLVQGQVLSGGKINISTNVGFVIAQKGSLIDVSGTSANIALPQIVSGALTYRSSHVAGDAGSINVTTGGGGFFDGTMNAGVEAGSSAAAGSLSLTLNNNPGVLDSNVNAGAYPLNPAQILVSAGGNGGFATQAGLMPGDDSGAGNANAPLTAIAGKYLLDANALQKSGFDQVALKSGMQIVLADQVNLQTRRSLTLDAPQLVSNGSSSVTSAHVTLGNLDQANQAALPLSSLNPAAGIGALNVAAQLVDLTGNFMVSGVNQFNVASSGDIRLNGVVNSMGAALTGSLRTQGNVTLQADQVYPTTMAQFNLLVEDGAGNAAGNITILPGQHGTSPVMSAGGQLTLSAANIVQKGVVKAPLGTLTLNGSQSVTLESGSLTSVSADGLTIPFGLIQGGNAWMYDLTGNGNLVAIVAPPQKIVKLTAPNINVKSGATVNLSGGGDLYANEFFAGSGGSVNVLDPTKAAANTYAIIPGMSGYAPYDPQSVGQYAQAGSNTALQSGRSVYLAGGNGIPAGYYTLLPASYALLPGAYRVTAVTGYADRQPGQGPTTLADGSQIMAGKFAVIGTNIQDARYSGFAVTSGAVVRTQSEYHDSYANAFFTAQALANGTQVSRLASDAGQLIVSAIGSGATLALDGALNTLPAAGGQGALVDLNGPGFDIVNTTGPANGLVQLTSDSLNKLGAESLLIGGVRTQSSTGMTIAVGAGEVRVDNAGSVLSGPEIILAANNAVTVKMGSDIEGKGAYTGQASNINIGSASVNGDGALLRVSSATQVTVARSNLAAVPVAATLTVENGATVGAQNAVLLDSSYATTMGSSATLKGKALSVAAQSIDIGTNPAPAATSLALSGSLLTQALTFKDLTLHSYNDINFYASGFLGGLDVNQQHILNNLVLNSRSLNGISNPGATNIIDAANVTLMNNNAGTSAAVAYGAGNLKVNADQITLAAGDKSVQGFDTVTFAAAKQILAQETSSVTLNAGDANVHDLVLQAGQITGSDKSNLVVTASNDVITIQPVAGVVGSSTEALNAKLNIIGKSIVDNGVIDLPSGSVSLHATGTAATDGVTLGSASTTVANGLSKTIAGQTVYAPAGTIALTADNGGVDIQSGAVVDVSGATGGGDAGSLNIAATNGAVSVAGNLKGAAYASNAQGSFTLDAKVLSGATANALTGLNDTLTAGGFTNLRDMRVRTGNLVLAADLPGTVRAKARTFHLTADAGSIDVFGTVDSSGTSGGNILLAANNNLTMNTGALLDAHGVTTGGKVTLETTTGVIELNNQLIDVHGSGNTGGSVLLRAPQINANTDVAINNTGGTSLNVSPNANVTLEAFRTYAAPATLAAADVAETSVYFTDATTFANNVAAIKTRFGINLSNLNQHVTPGVELDSPGDITLAANWDLSAWRFNDGTGALTEPGILTLRAGGNLNFGTGVTTSSLTDGFTAANNIILPATVFTPTSTASWSYRLIAGADSTSADLMAVNNTVPVSGGNVVLAAGTNAPATTYNMEQIRTGTGFIDIAAGGSLDLGNSMSVIYTAGQAATGIPASVAGGGRNYYGTNGGDISIQVQGDINGAPTNQLITDWQWRPVYALGYKGVVQPAWWINVGSFRQNIGTLGGGNLSVTAGGNINNLSAVAPTTGYVDTSNVTQVLGGGNLNVTAGGSINSGVFYVGNGQGTVRAGGDLGATRFDINNNPLYTILALGQGNFDVSAGGDLNLQTVLNPTALTQGYTQVPNSKNKTYFFTYGDTSGVSLSSLRGNVLLSNDPNIFYSKGNTPTFFYLNSGNGGTAAATVYPGSLQVTALGGSIFSNNAPILFPTANGNLKFVAAQDIQLTGQIIMSDASPAGLQANSPTTDGSTLVSSLGYTHTSLHTLDTQAAILSAGGNIIGDNSSPVSQNLVLPKSVQIQAGQDVQNLSLSVQNLNASDTTSVVAGRDIVFTPYALNPANTTPGITVAGPGQVVLQAGRNVDLGQSTGVTTTGNLTNPLLPDQGASVTVLAGVGQGATATQAFIDKYINPAASANYAAALIAYVDSYGAPQGQTAAQAFSTFSTLSKPLQEAFTRQVFFSELKKAGRSAVNTGNYKAGYDAIATLFPAGGYKGDINLYYSQIKTERGGAISLLTPGGGVNAGLANPSASGPKKTAAELGIVTVKGGDVNAFVNNDFTVNQSRVFTLQGGNILMWSSYGNIDAGKGSKTASATPPPLLVVDPKTGTFNVDVTQSVVGSGIRVLLANKNVVPGDVDLIAPAGTVNAGDAGIGSAGNITIAALHVVGADNINFGGSSAGVPIPAPAPVSVGLGNLQDASKAADQATQSLGNMNDSANMQNFKPTFLSVEVIGLGEPSTN